MTRAETDALLARHKAAFAARDPEALARDHAQDGTFESPAHRIVHGRAAILEVYRYWFTAFPDLNLTWDTPIVDGDRAAVFWSFAGTTEGPFFGIDRPGTRVTMTGAAEYRFAGGTIASVRHVFDFSGVLIKAGVLKARTE
jgi:predicted ester cyclase